MSDRRPNKRSEAAIAAAKHWSNKKRQRETDIDEQESKKYTEEPLVEIVESPKEVIIVSSEDEAIDDKDEKKPRQDIELKRSQIRLLSDPSYSLHGIQTDLDVNKDTLLLSDLVGSKDLKETFQFNFSVDLEFFSCICILICRGNCEKLHS